MSGWIPNDENGASTHREPVVRIRWVPPASSRIGRDAARCQHARLAGQAVEDLLLGADRERRRLLGVERAESVARCGRRASARRALRPSATRSVASRTRCTSSSRMPIPRQARAGSGVARRFTRRAAGARIANRAARHRGRARSDRSSRSRNGPPPRPSRASPATRPACIPVASAGQAGRRVDEEVDQPPQQADTFSAWRRRGRPQVDPVEVEGPESGERARPRVRSSRRGRWRRPRRARRRTNAPIWRDWLCPDDVGHVGREIGRSEDARPGPRPRSRGTRRRSGRPRRRPRPRGSTGAGRRHEWLRTPSRVSAHRLSGARVTSAP